MKEQLSNNNFELITQLLDGELTSEQAAEVTQMISEDPMMQAELDRQSEISNAIKKDDEDLIPPLVAKDNVFLALGIPIAASAPTLVKVASEAGNWVSMVAAFTATLMTFTMFTALNNVDHKAVNTKSNIPVVSSFEKASNNNLIVEDNLENQEAEAGNSEAVNTVVESANANNNRINSVQNRRLNTSNNIANSELNEGLNNNTVNPFSTENTNQSTNFNANLNENISNKVSLENRNSVNSWNAKMATNSRNGLATNQTPFLSGMNLEPNGQSYTRDYLTVIRTKAGSGNLNNGQLDLSFLTNYFMTDVRGIVSAGLSWYDQNSNADMRNPVYLGGGLEYTPTFTTVLDNNYFETFINGQVFIGSLPSYKLEAGLTTTLGGLTNFPIVFGYSKTYVRDYQFIRQESNEGIFIGTEISF